MDNIETQSRSALATGSIGARFISQNAVDEAKARREQEWKEAYERIGQEPPPQVKEEDHDGRTLFERLEEQKQLKQEWWDEKMKMKNQYRGLIGEEYEFLAEKNKEKLDAERKVEQEVNVELQAYREARSKRTADAVAAAEPRIGGPSEPVPSALTNPDVPPPPASSEGTLKGMSPSAAAPKRAVPPPSKPAKKDMKALMKGVVVKKKVPKAADKPSGRSKDKAGSSSKRAAETELPEPKKPRVE